MIRRYKITYTSDAERDLAAAYDYLFLKGSAELAEHMLLQIIDRVDALKQFPDRGSIPSDLKLASGRVIRQIVVGKYRILYQIIDDAVVVFLVSDGRRDMQALLRRRLLTPPDLPR